MTSTIIILIALVGLSVFLFSLKRWSIYKQRELDLLQNLPVRQRYVKALSAVWTLLRFLRNDSNDSAVFIEIRQQKLIRVRQGKQFIRGVQRIIYEEGYGLYLDTDLQEALFYCRTALYSVLKSEGKYKEGASNGTIALKNNKYKEEFFGPKYRELDRMLRAKLNDLNVELMTDFEVPKPKSSKKESRQLDKPKSPPPPAFSPPYSEL